LNSTRLGLSAAPALLLALIHRSAWKVNSAKFGGRIVYRSLSESHEDDP